MASDLGLGIVMTLKDLFSPKAKQVSSSMKGLKKDADNTVSSLEKMNRTLQGLAGAAIFTKSTQLFSGLFTPAIDLEKAMAKVNSRIEESGVDLLDVKKKLKSIGGDFGISTLEEANQLTDLLDGGFGNVSDALQILPLQNKLAKASFTDMGVAGKALIDVFNAFKPNMADMPKIANQLHILGKAGSGNFEFLAANLQRILPQAELLGIKFDDLAAVMMSMTENGVSQKNALAAISAAMDAMSTDTEKLDKVMKANGLVNTDNALKTVGFSNVLVGLMNVTDGNIDKWKELGFTGQALKSLFAGLDKDGNKLRNSMAALAGDGENLNRTYAKATDNMAERWQKAKTGFLEMATAVGERLIPLLSPVVEKMISWGQKIQTFIEKHPKFATAVAVGVSVIAALGVALGAVAAIVAVLAIAFSPLGVAIMAISAIIGGVITAFVYLKNKLMDFLSRNKQVTDKLKAAWAAVKGFFVSIGAAFTDYIIPAVSHTGQVVMQVIQDYFIAPLNSVIEVLKSVYQWFVDIGQSMADFFDEFTSFDWITNFGESLAMSNQTRMDFEKKQKEGTPVRIGRGNEFGSRDGNSESSEVSSGRNGRDQIRNNTDLSTRANPSLNRTAPAVNVNPIINVPPAKIFPAQVNIDKKKIGEVIFEMQKQATVRATQ